MMPIGGILIPTKLSQNLTIVENLERHVRDIFKVRKDRFYNKECTRAVLSEAVHV